MKVKLSPLEIKIVSQYVNFLTLKRVFYVNKKYSKSLQSIPQITMYDMNGNHPLLKTIKSPSIYLLPSKKRTLGNEKFETFNFFSQLQSIDSIQCNWKGVISTDEFTQMLYPTRLEELEIVFDTATVEEHGKQVDILSSTFTQLTKLNLTIDPGNNDENKSESLKNIGRMKQLQSLKVFGFNESFFQLTKLTSLNVYIDSAVSFPFIVDNVKEMIHLKNLTLRNSSSTFTAEKILLLTQLHYLKKLDISSLSIPMKKKLKQLSNMYSIEKILMKLTFDKDQVDLLKKLNVFSDNDKFMINIDVSFDIKDDLIEQKLFGNNINVETLTISGLEIDEEFDETQLEIWIAKIESNPFIMDLIYRAQNIETCLFFPLERECLCEQLKIDSESSIVFSPLPLHNYPLLKKLMLISMSFNEDIIGDYIPPYLESLLLMENVHENSKSLQRLNLTNLSLFFTAITKEQQDQILNFTRLENFMFISAQSFESEVDEFVEAMKQMPYIQFIKTMRMEYNKYETDYMYPRSEDY